MSAPTWPTPGCALPQPVSRSTGSRRRSRCPPTRCATTARRTRSQRSSRCSTTCSARRPATATRSWPSRTPSGQLLWVCGTPSVLRRAEQHRLRRGQQLGRAARRHQRPRHGPAPRPLGQRARRRALPAVGAAVELRGGADPRPVRPEHPRGARHHRRRRDRRAADDGDGAGRGAHGRGRAGARAARQRRGPRAAVASQGTLVGAHRGARSQRRPADRRRRPRAPRDRCASARATARSCCCSPRPPAGSPATSSTSCSTRRTAAPRP